MVVRRQAFVQAGCRESRCLLQLWQICPEESSPQAEGILESSYGGRRPAIMFVLTVVPGRSREPGHR